MMFALSLYSIKKPKEKYNELKYRGNTLSSRIEILQSEMCFSFFKVKKEIKGIIVEKSKVIM